ncbi:MAG TPA: hypothetical protein PLQ00_07830 [Thermoguttaceae bacterium]|nr:hypothetical protein [Thermoguttaceae bacterium]
MAKEPMGVLSGKDGSVWIGGQPAAVVLWWELVKRSACKAYVANDTGGWRRRVPGAKDASGRLELKLRADGAAPVEEGQEATLRLHLDGTGKNYYELPAIIERISARVDIAGGEVIGWVVDFVGAGPAVGHGIVGQTPNG